MSCRPHTTAALIWILAILTVLLCPLPGVAQTPAPINFIQGNYAVPRNPQTTVRVAYPATQFAGNLNVVVVGWNDSTAVVASVTDSAGNSYARAVGPTVKAGQATQSIYFASNIVAAAANSNIVTVQFDSAAAYPDVRIVEYSGIDRASPLAGAAALAGSSATSSSGSLTTSVPNVLLVAGNIVETSTKSAGTGFTSRMITKPDGDVVEDRVVNTAGSYTGSAPLKSAGYWVMQMAAFKAATIGSDSTGPSVVINSPTNGQTVTSSPITVSGTASDSGLGDDGISSVTVNGVAASGGTATGSGTANWSQSITLNSGANTITVVAKDNSTNQNSTTVQVTVNYSPGSSDTTGPSVVINSPTNGQTVTSSPITVSGTATDSGLGNNGISSVTVNGIAASGGAVTGSGTANWSQSIALNSGANTITVVAKDNSINQNSTIGSITVNYSAAQPAGLMAGYAFNETSGTTTADASGNGNTGILMNGVVFAAGKNGNAISLNGSNQYVNIGNAAPLQITGSMTISGWINASSFPVDDAAVVSKRSSTEVGFQFDTTVDTGPRTIGFKLTSSSGGFVARYGATTIQLNQWYYIAGVYNASTQTMDVYLNGQLNNGVLLGNVTSAQQNSSLSVNIGQRPGFPGTFNFAGKIDDLRIYNRPLSQAEIQSDMITALGVAPPPDTTPPIVAISAPAAASKVFGLVSVAANASDNVGIAGVQFFVDGQAIGTEAITPPFSVVWDTTTATLGNHVLTAVARDFSNNSTTSAPVSVNVALATPDLVGQWDAPFNWPIVAVHAYLLSTGEVMASDGQSFAGQNARIWNPATNKFTSVNITTGTNPFCGGHCHLPDGRILVAGGHVGSAHVGVTDTNIFDPIARQWTLGAPMHTPRWYPTMTTLPNGQILVTAGEINCDSCNALLPEIYSPLTNTWTELTGASLDLTYYPHMFVLPDGKVLAASTAESPTVSQVLDVTAQTWSVVDPNGVDGGSAAMYLPGKILKSGTSINPDDPPVPSAENTYVLDMTQPSPKWRETPPMVYPRAYHTLTILPDGSVLATGGGPTTDAVGVNDAIKAAELWSPDSETWQTMVSMQKPRLYHSTALLLPDARVLVAGGGRFNNFVEPTDQENGEIYSPPYLFKGTRPVISFVQAQIGYAQTINVQTPDASRIGKVSLIKLGSVTHAFNMDQRYVPLSFSVGTGTLSVQTPAAANLAPPGHYMLFIVDTNGIPSVATILNIQ